MTAPTSSTSPHSGPLGFPMRGLFSIALIVLTTAACRTEIPHPPADPAVGWSPPRVINDDGRGVVQFDPALATAPDGSVHAAWVDFRDGAGVFGLFHARLPAGIESESEAGAWEPNERVSDMIGPVCRDDPDVAVDSAGAVHVVWSDYRNVHPDIFISSKAPGAVAWSAPRVVNDDATDTIQWAPAIYADHEGGVWVVWSDYRDGDGAIYAARRDAEGSWAPSERVDDAPAGQQDRPAIAIAPTGEIFVAWHDMRDDLGDISAARRDPSTGEWRPAVRLNAEAEGRQASPTIAIDGDGEVIVAWYDERDGATIHAAFLAPTVGAGGARTYGDEWTADQRVSRPGPRTAERPAAAAGAGMTMVTWYEHAGIDGVILASERLPGMDAGWTEPTRIDGSAGSGAGRNPAAVIASDGHAHVAWYGDGDDKQKEIFHSISEVEPPERFEAAGRLIHSTGRDAPGCPADGFTLLGCDGEQHVLVAADADMEAELEAALGRMIRLSGFTRARSEGGERCRSAHVLTINVDPAACEGSVPEPSPGPAPGTGSIAGRLSISALASPGSAEIEIAGRRIRVGSDGRYFADAVPAGSHLIRAAGRCTLSAEIEVEVPEGSVLHVPPVTLLSGDVNGDCAIDLRDLVAVGALYGAGPTADQPCADINGDGAVDIFDLAGVSSAIGSACPAGWSSDGSSDGSSEAPASKPESATSKPTPALRTVRVEGSIAIPASDRVQGSVAISESDKRSRATSAEIRLGSDRIEVPIVVSEISGIVGFAVTMSFDPSGTRVVDAMPDVPGHQAADVGPSTEIASAHELSLDLAITGGLPKQAFVAANFVDNARGRLHIAVSGLDPAASGSQTLARLVFDVDSGSGRRPRVISLQLAGPGGSPIPARVEVGGFVAAPAYHMWLPYAASGALPPRR